MAPGKTSLTNSDLEILRDEADQQLPPVIRLECGPGGAVDPGTAVAVINEDSEGHSRA